MVPIPESRYFPSLDKCLHGDQVLISWKTALYTILNPDDFENEKTSAIEEFFSDLLVIELLAHPFDAFPEPSQQTKSAFETKTSAINVTPSSNTRYDIKEVKEDALWLSKEARIDEVSALRIVVLEFQSRQSAQLLGRFSNEELAGIQETVGTNQTSVPVALLSRGTDSGAIQAEFEIQENRQIRILRTYLSERQHLLQCVNFLLQKSLYQGTREAVKESGKGREVPLSRLEEMGNRLVQKMGDLEKWALKSFMAIETNIKNIDNGSGWYKIDGGRADVETVWVNSQIVEVTHTMEIVFQIIDTLPTICSSTTVLTWLRVVANYNFFDQFVTDEPSTEALVLPMKSATTIISLSILSTGACLDFLRDTDENGPASPDIPSNAPYILNPSTITEIHTILMGVSDKIPVNACPMILAWTDILQTMRLRVLQRKAALGFEDDLDRRSSTDSQVAVVKDAYENVVEEIMDGFGEDPIQYLALSAVDHGHVFDTLSDLSLRLGGTSNAYFSTIIGARMRIAVLDLIRSSSAVGYIPELVAATLSALTGDQNYWDLLDSQQLRSVDDPLAAFLADEDLVNLLLISARARYPWEPLPLLKMVRALAGSSTCYGQEGLMSLIDFIEKVPTFTYTLPEKFAGYETTQEEDNNNSIRLTTPVQLFEPRVRSMRGMQSQSSALVKMDHDFIIPAGTYGRMISESNPKVAYWFHEHSGFKYLGKLLETFLTAGDQIDAITGGIADRDSVADIIGTFANLLLGATKAAEAASSLGDERSPDIAASSRDDARRVLEIASSGLSRNRDITTIIFDIFEEELQRQSTSFGSEVSLDVLVTCVQFIHALIAITPGRVWPLISRSGLLDLGRGGGRLPTIVGSVELVSGRFDLLLSCTRLFESLVEDFVANAIARRCGGRPSARFGNDESTGTGVPDQVLSKVLLSFTRYFVDVLESSCTWKFAAQDDRRRLSKTVAKTFDSILYCAYGIDTQSQSGTNTESKSKIMEPLLLAASHVIESFLSTSSGTLRLQPLLRTFYDGFDTLPCTIFLNQSNLCMDQVNATLSFSKTLLRACILLERPPSQLESQLFKASPLISRLYAVNDAYRMPVVALFEALVVSASNNVAEPPSLLGHLGPQTSMNFLHLLSDIDKPLCREDRIIAVWHFLAMVVSSRQQWFANYLLTGKTSKNALKGMGSGKELAALDSPVLNSALDALSNFSDLPKPAALAMLDFVALAQNFWPWATYDSQKHATFIRSISEYVGTLKPIQPSTREKDSIDSCHQTRIAACIAEILTTYMFHSRQTGKTILAKHLLPNLSYYTRFAVAVPHYNSSLHANLKRNLEARYPGFSILEIERTSLEKRALGREYFYSLPLANKMLGFDPAWKRRDGFGAEVANANVNLSLVDAQIALLHSWSFLAIELSGKIAEETELQKVLAKVANDCLISNRRSQGLEEIFKRLNQRRADLALILMQRLIESKATVPEMESLLTTTWETIRHSDISFERALATGEAEYYRSLLKLLFLALRVHAGCTPQGQSVDSGFKSSLRLTQSSSVIPTVIELVERVVANGVRDLAAFIHDKPAESLPEDIALITGILQACLRIPGVEFCYSQIVSTFVANDTAHVATTLFSWSDSLAIEGDPVYGELSILFLLEMSTIPSMAEQLAIDGVLGHISSANITTYLRRGNVSPFADGAGIQRCYNIWVRGIIPLLLNLLDAVGASIATEVSLFLAQFPSLLQQASQAFDAPETSRTIAKSQVKYITLSTCSEVHSLSLILYILNGFREATAATMEIPEVKWDAGVMLENVEFWLRARTVLRERILPMGERDVAMMRQKHDGDLFNNKLEEKVVSELLGIRDVLSGREA